MELEKFKEEYYKKFFLFDPTKYGRIYVFVDFSNVRHWAKSFWPAENKTRFTREIDIEKLSQIIDSIKPTKKFFYYGHHKMAKPELPISDSANGKYRQSIYRIDKAAKNKFITRTKEIKQINDFDEEGKWRGTISKCNFDIEITMDMLLKIEKYDTIFLWSGDSDFHRLLQDLKHKEKKIITICARDFVSEELRGSSYLYIPADPLKEHLELPKRTLPAIAGREG